MTKKELVIKGKTLGLNLNERSLKADLEIAVAKAEKKNKAKTAPKGVKGEW